MQYFLIRLLGFFVVVVVCFVFWVSFPPSYSSPPARLLPWEQDFEKEEERGDSGRRTPASPGAHSLRGIQVCELPQPGGPLSPALRSPGSTDGDGGCQLAGAPGLFCSEDSRRPGKGESRVWFHPAAFNGASVLLSCPQFPPATSFRKALCLHYLPLQPSGPPT